MDTSARLSKEAFTGNNDGTDAFTVLGLMVVVPAAIFLTKVASSLLHSGPAGARQPHAVVRFAVEFCMFVVPTLLAMTSLASQAWWLAAALVAAGLLLDGLMRVTTGHPVVSPRRAARHAAWSYASGRPPFLTHLRAGVFVVTVLAILAADFPAFPRELLKTEVAGVSLMDMGVGAVVLGGAVASRQSRSVFSRAVTLANGRAAAVEAQRAASRYGSHAASAARQLFGLEGAFGSAVAASGPCLLLGLLRLAGTAATNYQTHVGEYGAHWNFFVTLALVGPLTVVAEAACVLCGLTPPLAESMRSDQELIAADPARDTDEDDVAAARARAEAASRLAMGSPSGFRGAAGQWLVDALPLVVCGLSLSGLHQLWLASSGFDWITGPTRLLDGSDASSFHIGITPWALVDANREGVTSMAGFLALSLIGVGIGRGVFLPLARHKAVTARASRLLAAAAGGAAYNSSLAEDAAADKAPAKLRRPAADGVELDDADCDDEVALPAEALWGMAAAMGITGAGLGLVFGLLQLWDGERPSGWGAPTPAEDTSRGFGPLSPSRRTANLTYVVAVASGVAILLAALLAVHLLVVPSPAVDRAARAEQAAAAGGAPLHGEAEKGPADGAADDSDESDADHDVDAAESEEQTPARQRRRTGRSSSSSRRRPGQLRAKPGSASGQLAEPHRERLGPWVALLDAANRHPLTLFLVGNVLTGVVNLTLQDLTLRTPNWAAQALLVGYTAACLGIVFELDRSGLVLSVL
ncbi:hypothetical protein FNF28_04519 [Cafeteria roenbergensis]|uniref:GPI-anchored wall transfer protein 1 n=1 Tax=Cafeteria roenbergensis TaxID=33653 RepID=A0A5A8DE08_CAFRO|nr:hypothetical protein FNF28_04519 [Cafeteria roenbergensis]